MFFIFYFLAWFFKHCFSVVLSFVLSGWFLVSGWSVGVRRLVFVFVVLVYLVFVVVSSCWV